MKLPHTTMVDPVVPLDDSALSEAILKHADGKRVCNCGLAYLTPCGYALHADPTHPNGWREVTDDPICFGTCATAQRCAANYLAGLLLKK